MDSTGSEINPNNPKIKHSVLKQIKGLYNIFKDSSKYWKGTISNLGKNFCQCNRLEFNNEIDNEDLTKIGQEVEQSGGPKPSDSSNNNKIEDDLDECNEYLLSKRIWTLEEDQKLLSLVSSTNSKNWKKISASIPNKTPQQCGYRYKKLQAQLFKKKFNRNDDITLIELTETFGKDWEVISSYMQGWTAKELEERFVKHLDPKLKRSKFEKEEDEMIIHLHEKYGNKWNEIAKHFIDRNASMIKNRYYSVLKKKITDNTNTVYSNTYGETSSLSSFQISNSKKRGNLFNVKKEIQVEGRKTISYNDLSRFNLNLSTYSRPDSVICESECNYKDDMSEMISKMDELKRDWSIFSENGEVTDKRFSQGNYFDAMKGIPQTSSISNNSNYFLQHGYDDDHGFKSRINFDLNLFTDTCTLPKEDSTSPILKPQNGDNFDEQYNNVFMYLGSNQSVKNNFLSKENENLKTQFKRLEETFSKVFEHTLSQMKQINFQAGNSPETAKAIKFLELDTKIDEKRQRLSKILHNLKEDYLNNIDHHHLYEERNAYARNSLLKQIEVLVELINATKLKISLLHKFHSEFDTVIV